MVDYIGVFIMVGVVSFLLSYTYYRKKAGRPVKSKFASRKFIVVAVAILHTSLASFGVEVKTEAVILVDVIAGVFVVFQGLIDFRQAKPPPDGEKHD